MRSGLAVAAIVAAAVAPAIAQTPPSGPASVQALVSQGKKVFEATCSSEYCHGPAGRGAQGPRLVDFPMAPDFVRATVLEGRSGTPMVSFKGVLEPAQLEAVIAYVLSISSGGTLPVSVAAASPTISLESAEPSSAAIAIGEEKGTPSAGAEVFFDATTLSSCRTCHTYNKRGGPLGLDFAQARKTPEEILAAFAKPRIASRAYPVITVTLDNGVVLTGIRGGETADRLSVFDVAVPPVRRSFPKSKIVNVKIEVAGIFDHTKLGYKHQQLLDVAALLGSAKSP